MKRLLAFLAIAFLAVAPVNAAMAEDHGAMDSAMDAAAEVAHHEVSLADGTVVVLEGDHAFVMDAEGNKAPAADGEHMLADGTVMSVMGGAVVSGMPHFEDAMPAEEGHSAH